MPASSLEAPLPGYWPAASWVHYTTSCNTQSSASEDRRDHRPKHVELIGIINKPLLLHLVGCVYYLLHSLQLILIYRNMYWRSLPWILIAFLDRWLVYAVTNSRVLVLL
jgi:hypothetical protein